MDTSKPSLTRLRSSLQRSASGGAPSIGQWLEFPGYTLARTVASLPGVDWVLIDCEHGNIDDAAMYHSIAAVAAAGSSPIVRIPGAENWMIKRALDAGAHGIMVPMVETVVSQIPSQTSKSSQSAESIESKNLRTENENSRNKPNSSPDSLTTRNPQPSPTEPGA